MTDTTKVVHDTVATAVQHGHGTLLTVIVVLVVAGLLVAAYKFFTRDKTGVA